jgi:hypothetical protein
MYTWKCHKETTCVVILNNKNVILLLFYKIMEQEGGMGPAWRVGTSERGRK